MLPAACASDEVHQEPDDAPAAEAPDHTDKPAGSEAATAHLPDAVVEAMGDISWHDRAHHDVAVGHLPDPEETEGMSLSEALTIAHDGHDHTGPSRNHALMVAGLGVEALLDAHANEPVHLVFTVDDEGTHEFRCTEECGLLHDDQRREMLVVT